MKIKELLEVDPTPFPTQLVKPTQRPPSMGAEVIPMEPFQQAKQLSAQRIQTQRSLDQFTQQYIETALWSSTGADDEPLDNQYSIDDISDETLMEMVRDCHAFQTKFGQLLSSIDDAQAGHDFWLTRNHHGAGFWDRDHEGDLGEQLTNAAHSFGETDLYVGDDGKIYS